MQQEVKTSLTLRQCIEAGLILTLVMVMGGLFFGYREFYIGAIATGILTLLSPRAITPFARFWFALSRLLGRISSTVILTFIFFLIITPVALFRRVMGKDTLRLKDFKQNKPTAFKIRDHLFKPEDMMQQF